MQYDNLDIKKEQKKGSYLDVLQSQRKQRVYVYLLNLWTLWYQAPDLKKVERSPDYEAKFYDSEPKALKIHLDCELSQLHDGTDQLQLLRQEHPHPKQERILTGVDPQCWSPGA